MIKKYLFLLVTIIFLIGLVSLSQRRLTLFKKTTSLFTLDPKKVKKIEIISKKNKTIFEKNQGIWLISSLKNFPAKTEELNDLLNKLTLLKNLEIVSINPKKYDLYEVSEGKGIKLTIYQDKDKKDEIIIGKTGPSFSGNYLKFKDRKEVFYSPESFLILSNTADFRDLTMIKASSDQVKKIVFKSLDLEFTLEKKTAKKDKSQSKWYLKDKVIEQSKINNFLTTISTLVAKDGFIDKRIEETGLVEAGFTLTIETKEGKSKTIFIGNPVKEEENPDYYAQIKGSSIIYTLSSTVFRDLQKSEVDFQ